MGIQRWKILNHSQNEDAVKEDKQILVVYGGSFDPPHQGHAHCLFVAGEFFKEASFLVLPSYVPPKAAGEIKKIETSFEQRMEMCELAFEGLSSLGERLIISQLEKTLPAPNYTYKTLEVLSQMNPKRRLVFLMGADQWQKFSSWKNPDKILAIADIAVVERSPSEQDKADFAAVVEELNHRFAFSFVLDNTGFRSNKWNSKVFHLDRSINIENSTSIRMDVKKGVYIDDRRVHNDVYSYILENNLYK